MRSRGFCNYHSLFDTNLEYGFLKYLELGAGYRLGYNINKDAEKNSFGRFNLDAKAKIDIWNFQAKMRIRYTNEDDFDEEISDPVNYLRYKAGLEYTIDKIRTEPYVIFELYHNLMKSEIDKSRTEFGLLFKLSKHHRIGTYYRLNSYLTSNKESRKIVGVVYKFKL